LVPVTILPPLPIGRRLRDGAASAFKRIFSGSS